MEELKKAFDCARVYRGHTTKEAAKNLNVSASFLNSFFKGEGISAPLEKKIRDYIYRTEIIRSIQKLGLDPYSKARSNSSKEKVMS